MYERETLLHPQTLEPFIDFAYLINTHFHLLAYHLSSSLLSCTSSCSIDIMSVLAEEEVVFWQENFASGCYCYEFGSCSCKATAYVSKLESLLLGQSRRAGLGYSQDCPQLPFPNIRICVRYAYYTSSTSSMSIVESLYCVYFFLRQVLVEPRGLFRLCLPWPSTCKNSSYYKVYNELSLPTSPVAWLDYVMGGDPTVDW